MAFTTPYVQKVALDLSISNLCKSERISPAAEPAVTVADPNYWDHYGQYTVSPNNAFCGFGYRDQACVVASSQVFPHIESSVQLSPHSIYEAEAIHKISAPSPPQSSEPHDFDSLDNDVAYQAFESVAMQAMAEKNGGSLLGANPRMRRIVQTNQAVDDSYRRQRERNNYAAKQSRDKRRLREVRLGLQVAFLKKKRDELRAMLAADICSQCNYQL